MPLDFIYSLLQQATAAGSKSTVMSDLRWMIAILGACLLGALGVHAPDWASATLVVLLVIVSFAYVGLYILFALRAPDCLRSEKFTIAKIAIEKSVQGDNLAGFIDPIKESPKLNPPKEPEEPKG